MTRYHQRNSQIFQKETYRRETTTQIQTHHAASLVMLWTQVTDCSCAIKPKVTQTISLILKREKVNKKACPLCSFADTMLIYLLVIQVTEFYYGLHSPLEDYQFVFYICWHLESFKARLAVCINQHCYFFKSLFSKQYWSKEDKWQMPILFLTSC